MVGLLGPFILFLGGNCFLDVVLSENVDFALKIQSPVFLSLIKKHVIVAWSLKWTVKSVFSTFLFACRNANKELRSRIFSLHLSCLCLLCLRNLRVSWEVLQISNILDDVSEWIILAVLRSDRLSLVHCNFSSSIAKQIHLPIQFVTNTVRCQLRVLSQSGLVQYVLFHHSFVLLSFKILEIFYRMIVLVSKLISLTVHSNLNSTCSGTENRTLAFVFDACHKDLLTNKCEKTCFFPCHAAIIRKRSELHCADLWGTYK